VRSGLLTLCLVSPAAVAAELLVVSAGSEALAPHELRFAQELSLLLGPIGDMIPPPAEHFSSLPLPEQISLVRPLIEAGDAAAWFHTDGTTLSMHLVVTDAVQAEVRLAEAPLEDDAAVQLALVAAEALAPPPEPEPAVEPEPPAPEPEPEPRLFRGGGALWAGAGAGDQAGGVRFGATAWVGRRLGIWEVDGTLGAALGPWRASPNEVRGQGGHVGVLVWPGWGEVVRVGPMAELRAALRHTAVHAAPAPTVSSTRIRAEAVVGALLCTGAGEGGMRLGAGATVSPLSEAFSRQSNGELVYAISHVGWEATAGWTLPF
jgi:hypothetical protein